MYSDLDTTEELDDYNWEDWSYDFIHRIVVNDLYHVLHSDA